MKRSRFDDNQHGERRFDERQGYNDERRRDNDSYSRRPYAQQQQQRSNNYSAGAEPILDEDLLICPTYDTWKRTSNNTVAAVSSQDELVAQYCDHVKRWVNSRVPTFVERHWFEDWFLERYDPERALQRRKDRIEGVQKRANMISAQDFVTLTAAASSQQQQIVVSGLEFSMNDGCSAFLPAIPTSAPRQLLERVLQEKHGALQLFIGETNRSAKRKDLNRKGIITFKDAQSAKDLVQQGYVSFFVTSDADGVTSESSSEKDLKRKEVRVTVLATKPAQNRILPSDEAERTEKDEAQALSCAKALDALFQVERGIEHIIADRASEVSVLDATVQYLRYVHLYCYFTGAWFKDMGEMLLRAPAPFLRVVGSSSADGKFFESVDACAERILQASTAEEFSQEQLALESALEEKTRLASESVEEFMRANIVLVKKEEHKTHYQCATHQKVFETEQFLRKHLTNFHALDVRLAARKPLLPLFQDRFAADEDRPLPRLPRFVEEALRDEFVPPAPRTERREEYHGREPHHHHQHHHHHQREHNSRYQPPPPPQHYGSEPASRRYHDRDEVAASTAATAGGKVKLQYRTRVNYAETL